MSRTFLGWDRPALPAAAEHLIEHYADGPTADLRLATLVLSGRRARRRIVELLLEKAEARGVLLIPPVATTVGDLPRLFVSSSKPLADGVISRRAWSRALRSVDRGALEHVFPHLPDSNSLPEWDELAGVLAGLHQSLAGEGHRFADVARIFLSGELFDDSGRWEALARVQRRYLRLLEQAGLADPFEARLAALDSSIDPFKRDLWLVSIVELPAVTRRLAEASGAEVRALIHAPSELDDGVDARTVFDAFGLPSADYWETAQVPVTEQVLEVVERPVDQAEAVIDSLAALGGSRSAEEIVLGVHADSEVVPYLEQRLEARDVNARYAGGTPFSSTRPIRLLHAIADYLDTRSFQALAALLRHPDAGALLGPSNAAAGLPRAIEAADDYFAVHLPFRLQADMPSGRRAAARFPPIVRAMEREGPLSRFGGRQALSQWMPLVMGTLAEAYGALDLDHGRRADRRVLEILSRIHEVAAALAESPAPLDEQCTGCGAIRALLLDLREESLAPEPGRDAVELLDWLELALDDAPVVVLTAFNEGFLPESVRGHAFLPDALRTRLGLIDNRRRMARDAYRLTTVLHSKDSVRLIAGRRSAQGDALRPSRLMFRIPEEQMAPRVLHFLKRSAEGTGRSSLASLGLQSGARSRFCVPPEPVISLGDDVVPTNLAVTSFKALLNDPYRFVLERLYRLNSVDDTARELDPLGFGILAHHVLHGFGLRALESPPGLDVRDETAIAEALVDLLAREVSKRFGADAMPAVALQAEQLATRLRAFAAKQAEWAAEGWKIVAVECQPDGDGVAFDVDGEPFLLRGRIDRIDRNPSTGEWAVLDYKTSDVVVAPDKAHRKGRGDERRWVDLQLPLYRRLLSGVLDDNGRRVVPADCVEQGRIRLGYVSLPKKAADSEFLLAEWDEADFEAAEATARDVVRRLREGRFEFDSSTTKVSRFGSDALEPLLTVVWQATGEGEGDGGAAAGQGERGAEP